MVETAKPQVEGNGDADATHNQFNQSDTLYWIHRHREIEAKEKALKKERNMLRRDMKNQGVMLNEFDRMRGLMEMSDSAIEDTFKQLFRLMRFVALPIGTQIGFFDDRPEAPEPKDARQRAGEQGFMAGATGANQTDNPHELNTDAGQAWLEQWHKGQAELAKQIKSHKQ